MTETGLRDHIGQVDGMPGQAAAQSQMHMKQIDEKQSPIGKKIIARLAWQVRYSLLAVEEIVVSAISINPTAAAAKIR